MQANALLNVLMSMPGSTASFVNGSAANGGDLSALLGLGGAPVQNTTALNGQFAGILNNKLADGTQTALLGTVNANDTITPTGDITPSPQDSGIAIPHLGMYIDQPVKSQVVSADTANSLKQLIIDATNQKDIKLSESITNQIAIENNKTTTDTLKGKIVLAGLEPQEKESETIDQQAFLKAFEKIAAKTRTTPAQQLDALPTASGKVLGTQEVDISTRTEINETFEKLVVNEPLITAKIISSKQYTISSDTIKLDVDNSLVAGSLNSLNGKFSELDKQIKFSELTGIKTPDQTPVDQIHLKIRQASEDGIQNIKIKLYPAELGQVDVDMDVDRDGNTSIRITAENQTAIDILRKDSHNLERSLRDAGIKTDGNTLEFSLRGDQQNQQQRQFSTFGENQQSKPNYAQVEGYSKRHSITESEIILGMSTDRVNILA